MINLLMVACLISNDNKIPKHQCFGCTKRHLGCRSDCESWIKYENYKIGQDKCRRIGYLQELNNYVSRDKIIDEYIRDKQKRKRLYGFRV